MQTLRFIHVTAMILWLGSSSVEILLEIVLWRTKSGSRQKQLIEFHQICDFLLEGPAWLITIATGVLMLWKGGYLREGAIWPAWFEDKLLCASVVIGASFLSFIFVFLRTRATDHLVGNEIPLAQRSVRQWHLAATTTIAAAPFALLALWFAVNRGN